LLTARGLTQSFDSRPLFKDLDFVIQRGERIGLIGPNGAGKSSLLKILAKVDEPLDGEVICPSGVRVAYVSQSPELPLGLNIRSALASGSDSWEVLMRADQVLWQLKLQEGGLEGDSLVKTLSGGWKKRLAIARAFVEEPDLLLLDEPTNHLDIEGIEWLETILREASFATLTVTHDRQFLQASTSRIIEIDRRHPRGLLSIDGNYAHYLKVRASLLEAQENREEILRGVLRRETEWLKAGVKARTTKQRARIDRHEDLSGEVAELAQRNKKQQADFQFSDVKEAPQRLLEAKRIAKSYPSRGLIFSDLDLRLSPGMRVAVMGPNGCGKSTLLKVLLGQEPADKGHLFYAEAFKVAFYEQDRDQLEPRLSLVQTLCPAGDHVFYRRKPVHIRSYLERFMFKQDQMDRPVGSLSGGEQSRLLLARLMLIEANVLVLDEPTNDLDLETLNVLEECLDEFEGAILLVSHDRAFVSRLATHLLSFASTEAARREGKLQMFSSFEQWHAWYKSPAPSKASPAKVVSTQANPQPKPLKKNEAEKVLKKIERAEAELLKREQRCALPEISADHQKLQELGREIKDWQEKISQLYAEWESLEKS
jgi:ATP-binding cassette subfamily F protein uup